MNAIAEYALRENMEFIFFTNDDSELTSSNWTTQAINHLRSYVPPCIGTVGPTCNEGNTDILTHFMVHRSHFEIFGHFFPTEFQNWWADNWLTEVYKPDRSIKMQNWTIFHHLRAHGTRYKVKGKNRLRLNELPKDRLLIDKYVKKLQFKSSLICHARF